MPTSTRTMIAFGSTDLLSNPSRFGHAVDVFSILACFGALTLFTLFPFSFSLGYPRDLRTRFCCLRTALSARSHWTMPCLVALLFDHGFAPRCSYCRFQLVIRQSALLNPSSANPLSSFIPQHTRSSALAPISSITSSPVPSPSSPLVHFLPHHHHSSFPCPTNPE